jgi:hypothetical protein
MTASHRNGLLALLIGLLVTVALSLGHRQVGYVRDEGVYFEAARRYATWFAGEAEGRTAQQRRDRTFRVNKEHPALIKSAAGLSARVLASPDGGLTEAAAMRLPAQVLAGAGAAVLFLAGVSIGGLWAGLFAAGWFILLPRVWFHAGLLAFDVPIAVATLFAVLAYRRGLASWRWGLALGPILGVAIAIKHNALFLGPLLGAHYYLCLAWARWRVGVPVRRGQILPLPFVSALVLAPLTAVALWPWLWSDPIGRTVQYFRFHLEHQWYNMEFLGHNYNLPPLPVSYPWVMTWATVPTVLLVMAIFGLVVQVRADLRELPTTTPGPGSFTRPLPAGIPTHDGLLWTLLALFPLLLIGLPSIPIFGGTKHWLTAYPFLALAAARAWTALVPPDTPTRIRALALGVCLTPALAGTVAGHPYGLSQYSPLVGGPRGAADLGLNRGFWGHSVRSLLPELPASGRIYIHDVHEFSRQQYEREGVWPPELTSTPPGRADSGLLFHEMHMTTYEVQLWNRLETTAPDAIVELHDVPLTSAYVDEGG